MNFDGLRGSFTLNGSIFNNKHRTSIKSRIGSGGYFKAFISDKSLKLMSPIDQLRSISILSALPLLIWSLQEFTPLTRRGLGCTLLEVKFPYLISVLFKSFCSEYRIREAERLSLP